MAPCLTCIIKWAHILLMEHVIIWHTLQNPKKKGQTELHESFFFLALGKSKDGEKQLVMRTNCQES